MRLRRTSRGNYRAWIFRTEGARAAFETCLFDIHLNPVRAGILPAGRLDEFRYSSYWYLRRPKQRPARLRMEAALSAVGDLPDRTAGWKCYADHLVWQAAEGPAGKNAA